MFKFLRERRYRKFCSDSMMRYGEIAFSVGVELNESDFHPRLVSRIQDALRIVFETAPSLHDGAIVISDILVEDAESKVTMTRDDPLFGLLNAHFAELCETPPQESLFQVMARADLEKYEKAQRQAFLIGTQNGSTFLPKCGSFGREVSKSMSNYIRH